MKSLFEGSLGSSSSLRTSKSQLIVGADAGEGEKKGSSRSSTGKMKRAAQRLFSFSKKGSKAQQQLQLQQLEASSVPVSPESTFEEHVQVCCV